MRRQNSPRETRIVMAAKRVPVLIAATLLSVILGCDNGPKNSDQIAFITKIHQLQSKKDKLDVVSWRGKDDSGRMAPSDISTQIKEVESEIWSVLKNSKLDANQWNASVISVKRSENDILIHSAYGSQDYYLNVFDENSKKIAEQFKEDDKITFSGNLGAERSQTLFGATMNQDFLIYPTRISSSYGEIRQDEAIVKTRISSDQSNAVAQQKQRSRDDEEERLKDRIIELCKDTLRSNMKYPESVSFSWFKRNFKRHSENKWTYYDVVEAKNDFGGSLPSRFECDATVSGDRIEVSLNILDGSN